MKMKIIIGLVAIFVLVGGVFAWKKYSESKNVQKFLDGSRVTSIENSSASTTQNQVPVVDEFEHDRDYDGLSDVKEAELGLSDKTSDTDKDGLTDFTEIEQYKTDPKNKDTDGDGYVDGYEVLNGFNPKGAGKLNP